MKVTIGFCEIALVVSLFFYQQSWWIGVGLLSAVLSSKLISFMLAWQEEQDKKKQIKDASDSLKRAITELSKPAKKGPGPTLVFNNPDDDKFH